MESLQSAQASPHNADAEQMGPRDPTRSQEAPDLHSGDSTGLLAQDTTEDVFDFLNWQDDNDLLWIESPGNTLDVWHDAQSFPGSGNDLARDPEKADGLPAQERKHSSATLNPFLLLHGAYYPPAPCTYCLRYGLQCVIVPTMTAGPGPAFSCSTCLALCRECSLAQGETGEASQFETLAPLARRIDTPSQKEQKAAEANPVVSPNSNVHMDATYDRNKRSSSRKTQHTRPLRAWFSSHLEHPYPSLEDTILLSRQSGLTETQITNWFTNARRRQKASGWKVSSFKNSGSQMQNRVSDMTPFQRWQHSFVEEEHFSPGAIAAASASQSFSSHHSPTFSELSTPTSNLPAYSPAISESSHSASSTPPMRPLSADKLHPPTSHPRKARKTTTNIAYQCTFCRIPFKKKHDWVRHERSVHMPCLETYTCAMPQGTGNSHPFQIKRTNSSVPECALCGHASPDEAHYKAHDFETCSERPLGQRTFSRKDHFWQHLCKYHNCRKWEGWGLDLNMWRQRNDGIGGRCGFCGIWLDTWDKRMTHVEHHFKTGMQMDEWVAPGGA